MKKNKRKKLILWGGTGNFRVLCEFLQGQYQIVGFFDNNTDIHKEYKGIPYLGNKCEFEKWIKEFPHEKEIYFICCMGPGYGFDRLALHEELKSLGLKTVSCVHPTAFKAESAYIGEGTQLYAQSAVCVDSIIGKACIINTSASVDHECVVEDGVSIGPGARLAGLVQVGKYADIYTGAIILPRLKIGEGAVIGAGSVVLEDVAPQTVVVGNPAKVIKQKKSMKCLFFSANRYSLTNSIVKGF